MTASLNAIAAVTPQFSNEPRLSLPRKLGLTEKIRNFVKPMQEFYEIISAATTEQRQNLAELTRSGFGASPEILCDHIQYLRNGSIGQIFCKTSWKQIVTDVADYVGINWPEILGDRTWNDLSTQEIENAVVVKQFQNILERLTPEQRQKVLMDLQREGDDPHFEGFLLGGGVMLAAKMSGFGVYSSREVS